MTNGPLVLIRTENSSNQNNFLIQDMRYLMSQRKR